MGCQLDSGLSSSSSTDSEACPSVHTSFEQQFEAAEVEHDAFALLSDVPARKERGAHQRVWLGRAPAAFVDHRQADTKLDFSPLLDGDLDTGSSLSTDLDSDTPRLDDEEISGGQDSVASVASPGPLLIFDWDDTLFPTTWAQRNDLMSSIPSRAQLAQLEELTECVSEIVALARRFGQVIIVTNADAGWVELSSELLMPSLCELLSEVEVISARGIYETAQTSCPFEWKRLCFAQEIDNVYGCGTNVHRNVVCLGDSMHEHVALARVAQGLTCSAKSLKFAQFPTVEELIEQHQRLKSRLVQVINHRGDLHMEV